MAETEIKPGNKAPGFKILTNYLVEASLNGFAGKFLSLCSVPSLDRSTCDL